MIIDTINALHAYVSTLDFGKVNDWTVSDLEELMARARKLKTALESRIGPVNLTLDMQDTNDYARLGLPPSALVDSDNPYVYLVLSQYGDLVSIPYEWDVKPAIFSEIMEILEQHGYHYVSYRIFGNPENNDWRYAYGWQMEDRHPPEGKNKLDHEQLWMDLFDYK